MWVLESSCLPRDWFLKGNLLIIMVSFLIILPLALMKHLGKEASWVGHWVAGVRAWALSRKSPYYFPY